MSRRDDFDEDWAHGDDDTPTARCSNCRREIYREADSCPYCGEFLTADASPLRDRPKWFVMLGLLGILAVVLILSGVLQIL